MAAQVPLDIMMQLVLQALSDPRSVAQSAGQAGVGIPPNTPGSTDIGTLAATSSVGPGGIVGATPAAPAGSTPQDTLSGITGALKALQPPQQPQTLPAPRAVAPAQGRAIQAPGIEQLLAALLPGGGQFPAAPSLGALISGRV